MRRAIMFGVGLFAWTIVAAGFPVRLKADPTNAWADPAIAWVPASAGTAQRAVVVADCAAETSSTSRRSS